MEDRLIELEKKVAFQDQEIRDLTQGLTDQHKMIEDLTRRLKVLQDKMDSGPLVKDADEEEPPPHY